ncbi:hypothetical protein L2E82_22540 [Cichorium intybus]|uniref:Uncharacterized protein n=1 Tax=Cichorium intybus TaxID=13427 RepID=A0ACB9DXN2_CICIN|nr:hypothetical protein L2E82_22540 [Cichorium intybus]
MDAEFRNMGQESSPSHDDIERNIFWSKGREVFRSFVENNTQNHFTVAGPLPEWGPMSDEGLRIILDFNPSAASISLSTFRGTNYGFEALSRTFKKDSYSQKHGNCRMTRSYRNVQPILAKLSNIQYKCVQEIMTAMAATTIAANLISQPNLRQILMMAGIGMGTNFLLAMRPERTHNRSPLWLKVFC